MNFLAILAGVLKFWDQVVWLVKKLEKTPSEKVSQVIREVDQALTKAEKDDDTSEIEDLIRRR